MEFRIPGSPDQLDLHRFERLVAEAREAGPGEAAELLHRALGLWRGPPSADLQDEPFAGRDRPARGAVAGRGGGTG